MPNIRQSVSVFIGRVDPGSHETRIPNNLRCQRPRRGRVAALRDRRDTSKELEHAPMLRPRCRRSVRSARSSKEAKRGRFACFRPAHDAGQRENLTSALAREIFGLARLRSSAAHFCGFLWIFSKSSKRDGTKAFLRETLRIRGCCGSRNGGGSRGCNRGSYWCRQRIRSHHGQDSRITGINLPVFLHCATRHKVLKFLVSA
jgi:hypothetical protein